MHASEFRKGDRLRLLNPGAKRVRDVRAAIELLLAGAH